MSDEQIASTIDWLHTFPEGARLTVRREDTGELAELENEGLPWCDWAPALPEAVPVLSPWWQRPAGMDAPGLTPRRLATLIATGAVIVLV
ncbi:hypothetical protein [Microbacterium lacticum]